MIAPASAPSRLRNNTAILAVNNILGAGLAFLISVAIGRGLGAQGLGQYAFIMAWMGPLIALADFGLGTLITRDVAQDPVMALPLLRITSRTVLLLSLGLIAGTWLIMPLLQLTKPVVIAWAVLALLIFLDSSYGLYTALFRALQRMLPILLVNVGGLILQLPLAIVAIASGTGLPGLAVVVVGVNVLQLVAAWGLWKRLAGTGQGARPAFLMTTREIMLRAWPFALAAFLSMLQLQLNVLLLQRLSGDVATGVYSAASPFVEAGKLIPTALFGALFPALVSLAAQPVMMRETFIRASVLLALFAFAFGLGMTLFGGTLIHLTYDPRGTQFVGAATVLTILSWSLMPALLKGVATLYLYATKREHYVNVVLSAALCVQAILGWLFIGRWGAPGAALTVIVVEGGSLLCLYFGLRRRSAFA